MIYRTITPTDYDELSQVMKAAYAEAPWNENWSDERANRRVQAIMGNFQALGVCAVEADGEKILGRVPPFTVSSNMFDMFGQDFIGISKYNKEIFNDKVMLFKCKAGKL